MDGIGGRPQLRASGTNGDPLADRAYPIEAVPDVPSAMGIVRHLARFAGILQVDHHAQPLSSGARVRRH
jgi:hypothetical protein